MAKHKIILSLALSIAVLSLNACTTGRIKVGNQYSQASAISGTQGTYKVGKPYKIMGKWYYPKEDYSYSEVGTASWYGEDFHAKYTANGEIYDMNTLTAAHRTLPLPSIVRVTNLENGRSLVLRVNDRGPFAKNRIIDVSKRSATLLGFKNQGVAKVRVELLPEESKALKQALLTGCKQPVIVQENNNITTAESAAPVQVYKKGSYFVQAGAYANRDSAVKLGSKLDQFGTTNVYKVDINRQSFYRVRLGPYADKKAANAVLDKLQNYGVYDARVVQD